MADKSDSLTDQQELFCQFYAKFPNGSRAYRRAYPDSSVAAAESSASALLRIPKVKKRIEQIKEDIIRHSKVVREQVVAELAEMGFSNTNIEDLQPKDRLKAVEMLAKILGFLDGNGESGKKDRGAAKERLEAAIDRLEKRGKR